MSIWQSITELARSGARAASGVGLLRALGMGSTAEDGPELGVAFTIAIVALSAKMAKSDGFVTVDEVEAFRRVCTFPQSEEDNVRHVFDLARQDVAGFESYAQQVAGLLESEPLLRRDVLEGLFVIAAADGVLHDREEAYLKSVASHLAIGEAEFAWVRSLFVAEASGPYEVLGLSPSATDAEVRARYRALVIEHHPDRLVGRGVPPDFVIIAERMLASINAAYEVVARERGL